MHWIALFVFLASIYPLFVAWIANRGTTMVHAVSWTAAAWLGWLGAFLAGVNESDWAARYLALALTSCAIVAVLGARRPIVGAWNFVVLGLLAVLLLPLAENTILGTPLLDPLRLIFVSGTILVGLVNYLPTRFGTAALLVGISCVIELTAQAGRTTCWWSGPLAWHASPGLLATACWAGWLVVGRRAKLAVFDREWLTFRDRFGLLWGQRVREQFNCAAANAGWAVFLRWGGLRKTNRESQPNAKQEDEMIKTLRGLLKRFSV